MPRPWPARQAPRMLADSKAALRAAPKQAAPDAVSPAAQPSAAMASAESAEGAATKHQVRTMEKPGSVCADSLAASAPSTERAELLLSPELEASECAAQAAEFWRKAPEQAESGASRDAGTMPEQIRE